MKMQSRMLLHSVAFITNSLCWSTSNVSNSSSIPSGGPRNCHWGFAGWPRHMQSRRCNGCLAVPALGEISRVTGVAKRQIVGDAITNSHSWHLNPHVVEVPRSSLALTAPRWGCGIQWGLPQQSTYSALTVGTTRDSRPFGFVDAKVSSVDVDAGVWRWQAVSQQPPGSSLWPSHGLVLGWGDQLHVKQCPWGVNANLR